MGTKPPRAMSGFPKTRWLLHVCAAICALAAVVNQAWAHGGVAVVEDMCAIQIGFFKAHFKAYQPGKHQHQEFCEDLPDAAETVFAMEYLHGDLGTAPIEFRIIKDQTGHGAFASLEDVEKIPDLDAATVLYRPPTIRPDVFTVVYDFTEPGWYIGIVKVKHPTLNKVYTAVFPFKVGFTGFGPLPWLAGLAVLAQLGYWLSSGHLARWRKRFAAKVLPVIWAHR
jgi:hypothetical protein